VAKEETEIGFTATLSEIVSFIVANSLSTKVSFAVLLLI
jgi:hypothetical protein